MSRPGAPTSRNTAMTAAGSVVAMIAPSSRQTVSPCAVTAAMAKPMTAVATKTATTARSRIGPRSGSISRNSMDSADWNRSGGRKTQR